MKHLAVVVCLLALSAGCKRSPTTIRPDPGPDTLRAFNVNSERSCDQPVMTDARRVAETANSVFWHDVRNPSGGFTDAEYQAIADRFEAEIWPVNIHNFGAPTDINNSGKIFVLYTRAVNELTPPNSSSFVGGFFWSRDLFPKSGQNACPASNFAEMFYMLAPDPAGEVRGNVRTKDFVRRQTTATLAHELQHLINASRRMRIHAAPALEEIWLDEGLSHIAEELAFYNASGLGPRQNISQQAFGTAQVLNAFNDFAIQNFGRLASWMRTPAAHSPIEPGDELAMRGASWQFLRYAADRRAGNDQQLWFNLVNTPNSGLDNLRNVLGTDPLPLYRDWGVAVYTDDAVPGVAPVFTIPSWNFRDIYRNPAFGGFPLAVRTLTTGVPDNVSLRAGSSVYFRFGVPPAVQADFRTSAAGTTLAGDCTPLNLAVGQVHQAPAATLGAVCLPGGAAGADYTVVAFHHSAVGAAFVDFTATATGVVPPVGPPSPDRAGPAGPQLSRGPELVPDHEFHYRLRERERTELPFSRGAFPRADVAAQPAPGAVHLSIVRTR